MIPINDNVKLESFLWYISILVILVIGIYVFYAFFSGQITGFAAFTLIVVTFVAFGFMMGVASYLGGQRKAGWQPEEEQVRWRRAARVGRVSRSKSIIPGFELRPARYGRYRTILLIIIAVSFLIILESPVLGLLVIGIAVISYLILRAVELFDTDEEI